MMKSIELISLIENNYNLKITSLKKNNRGLVHHVYKIETTKRNYYVKVRDGRFNKLPNIIIDPSSIKYEAKAIRILYKLMPSYFPKLIGFNTQYNMLIITDVIPNDLTLDKAFELKLIDPHLIKRLGTDLGIIHKILQNRKVLIRNKNENNFSDQLLHYRFGLQNNNKLNSLIKKLNDMPKQLVLGDMSPKNIGVSDDQKFTFCDFENFHYGNSLTDLGFLAASILIHNITNKQLSRKLLLSFIKGYISINKLNNYKNGMLKNVILGIMLYRLDNPVIPYEVKIQDKDKLKLISNVNKLLNLKYISWENIINNCTI